MTAYLLDDRLAFDSELFLAQQLHLNTNLRVLTCHSLSLTQAL
jgi:hypothetical protein